MRFDRIADQSVEFVCLPCSTSCKQTIDGCYQLGVECIEVMDYVIPQTDVGRLVGKYDGLPVVGKGGLTGNDNTACDIVERLFKESAR